MFCVEEPRHLLFNKPLTLACWPYFERLLLNQYRPLVGVSYNNGN